MLVSKHLVVLVSRSRNLCEESNARPQCGAMKCPAGPKCTFNTASAFFTLSLLSIFTVFIRAAFFAYLAQF